MMTPATVAETRTLRPSAMKITPSIGAMTTAENGPK